MTDFGLLLLFLAGLGLAFLVVHAVLYLLLGSEQARDAKRRNRRYEATDWTPWWKDQ